jgi:D-arginine dehydrogenase
MQDADVLIIGAGMAGASLAWRLARGGQRVRLLEREAQPGMHSTGRSAAMFMESYGPPGVRALTRASRDFYLHPPAGFADVPLLTPRSALFVATADQRAALESLQAELAASGTALKLLNSELIAQVAPGLRADLFESALLDENGFDIDVDALLQGFCARARPARSCRPARSRGRPSAPRAAGGCGCPTGRACRRAWWSTPPAPGPTSWRPVRRRADRPGALPAQRLHLPPAGGRGRVGLAHGGRRGRGLVLQARRGPVAGLAGQRRPVAPHDVQPEELDIALGIHRIEEATTLRIARPTATWAGLRSFVPDGEIVIGFDDARGLLLAGRAGRLRHPERRRRQRAGSQPGHGRATA